MPKIDNISVSKIGRIVEVVTTQEVTQTYDLDALQKELDDLQTQLDDWNHVDSLIPDEIRGQVMIIGPLLPDAHRMQEIKDLLEQYK